MRKRNLEASEAIRNIFALGFVSFFTDVSSEMCFSLLPAFILGLPGSSRAILGVIEGVAEALSYGIRAISGIFSDKFRKRKAVVFVGYALSNIIKPLFAVAQSAIDALIIRVAERLGKGIRTSPRDALLSESVSDKHRGKAFGLHRTLDQTGAILGPIIASFILLLGLTERDVFWFSFIPGSIALLILLLLVQERVGKSVGELKLLSGMRMVLKGGFPRLLVIVGIFSLGAFNFSFILLNAKEAGISGLFLPLVYAVINVAHTIIAIPAGILSDKVGKENVLIMGYGTFLATVLLLFLSPRNHFYVFLISAMFGIYIGIVETIQRALVPEYVESAFRGTAYGIYYLVVGSAFLGANIIVGSLWEYSGSSTAATYSAILSSIAIGSMLLFLGQKRRHLPDREGGENY